MLENLYGYEAILEVGFPGRPNQFVSVTQSPFLIGRGSATGNHLQLDDRRISRQCAALVHGESGSDRRPGTRQGIFVNGEQVDRKLLQDGDQIQFGIEDSYEITFRSSDPEVH